MKGMVPDKENNDELNVGCNLKLRGQRGKKQLITLSSYQRREKMNEMNDVREGKQC